MKFMRNRLFLATLIILITLTNSTLALTHDPIAFDEVWSELYLLDDNERADIYAEWRSREDYPAALQVTEAASSPIHLEGDIKEHHLDLPATDTPWLVHIEDVNIDPSDPDLVQVVIIDKPSGEGSIDVTTPSGFIDQGGGITVDPYSYPPQVKINSGTTQLMHAPQFIVTIEAPIDAVVAKASLPLKLLNFQGQRLDLKLQGDYQLDLANIQLDELKIQATGYGTFKLAGNANYASIDLSGSMEYDSTSLSTTKLHARLDGPLSARFGESTQSILEVRDILEISPPNGELIRLNN